MILTGSDWLQHIGNTGIHRTERTQRKKKDKGCREEIGSLEVKNTTFSLTKVQLKSNTTLLKTTCKPRSLTLHIKL